MSYPPTLHKTYTTGEILTAADLNSSLQDISTTNIPEDIDDYSVNTAEMQSTADPYPAASESLATTLSGELERIRYQIKAILGEAQWYIDPDITLPTINTKIGGAQFLAPNGVVGAPGFSFANFTTSGFYAAGGDSFIASVGGVGVFNFVSTTEVRPLVSVHNIDGVVGTPSYSFTSGSTDGFYRAGTNIIGVATAGADVAYFTATQLKVANGLVGAPGYSFLSSPNTGLYYTGGNTFAATANSTQAMIWSDTRVRSVLPLYIPDGIIGAAGMAFNTEPDTGLYRIGADNIGITLGGVNNFSFATTGLSVLTSGSAATPAINWITDTDTGFYRVGVNQIGVAVAGGALLHMNSNGFYPDSDDGLSCGLAGNRWSDLRSVLINGADYCFANGYILREYPCTKEDVHTKSENWMKENANKGIQIINDKDEMICVISRDGTIYAKEFKSLKDLK